ncbi:MAG: lytic murein transglycosylase [Syntrophales bacterium]
MSPRTPPLSRGEKHRSLRHVGARLWITVLFLAVALGPTHAADWSPLTERLAADGFDREAMAALFARPEVLFEPEAMSGKLKGLLLSRTPEAASLTAALRQSFYRNYLTHVAISRAHAYLEENKAVLEGVSAKYGVPREIIVAILLVETRLGRHTGDKCVFNRLASMARSADLETIRPFLDASLITPDNEEYAHRRVREKADWAYGELKALLMLAERDGADPLAIRGSIYGAIGICQFMPSNVISYGIDADRDGRTDPFATPDALHSIANYLRGHGWREGMDREGQQRVIFAYNHSSVYAETILTVAEKLRSRPHP